MVHHGSNDALNILQQSWRNRWNGSDLVVLVGEGQASPTRRATTCHAWPCLQQRRHGHLQHFMTRSWRHHDEILIVLGKLLEDGQFFLTHTHTHMCLKTLSSTIQYSSVLHQKIYESLEHSECTPGTQKSNRDATGAADMMVIRLLTRMQIMQDEPSNGRWLECSPKGSCTDWWQQKWGLTELSHRSLVPIVSSTWEGARTEGEARSCWNCQGLTRQWRVWNAT